MTNKNKLEILTNMNMNINKKDLTSINTTKRNKELENFNSNELKKTNKIKNNLIKNNDMIPQIEILFNNFSNIKNLFVENNKIVFVLSRKCKILDYVLNYCFEFENDNIIIKNQKNLLDNLLIHKIESKNINKHNNNFIVTNIKNTIKNYQKINDFYGKFFTSYNNYGLEKTDKIEFINYFNDILEKINDDKNNSRIFYYAFTIDIYQFFYVLYDLTKIDKLKNEIFFSNDLIKFLN